MHVRRDDLVVVSAGNDSGKKGKVLRVDPKEGRIIVEGVNLRWKNLRKSQKNPKGGRVNREMAIAITNVLPFCGKCNKGARVRYQVKDGHSVRVCAKCSQLIGVSK